MHIRCVLLIAGLATASPAAATELDSLASGTPIRLRTKPPESVRVAGTFVRRDVDRLLLSADAAERAIPLASVERVEARAIGATLLRIPVPCEGSTITGRCDSSFATGMAFRSRVLRV